MYDFQEQFYQVMTRLRANSRSRAASTPETRETEMVNGLLVSKPIKKEPEITILNDSWEREREKSKAASVPGINKMKEIHDFINRRY